MPSRSSPRARTTRRWCDYARRLKAALIETVAQGTITGDLKGKTTDPESETVVDMYGFLDAIEANLAA
jgi:isocitrate dehydrogenase